MEVSVCLSVSPNFILYFSNNKACFLPGPAKELSAPPRTYSSITYYKATLLWLTAIIYIMTPYPIIRSEKNGKVVAELVEALP